MCYTAVLTIVMLYITSLVPMYLITESVYLVTTPLHPTPPQPLIPATLISVSMNLFFSLLGRVGDCFV